MSQKSLLLKILFLISLLVSQLLHAQHRVYFSIGALPSQHPKDAPVYLAGSFNNWNPANENFRFKQDNNNPYYLDISLPAGTIEYKITRGGWDKVECKKDGKGIDNRTLTIAGDVSTTLAIEAWQDQFAAIPVKSSATARVCIFDSAFSIPQLQRTRRVWIYLPGDYCDGNREKYPVLYMHDGQNVFDDATSFSGEWGIDEFMDTVSLRKCIVVAVDHGGDKRLNEYNPYNNERFGTGEGNAYVDFLVQTLKPYIDKQFRTKKGREHTFIAGSSMGGLISLYAVLKYPKVFGGAGIFSPAFWISGTKIYEDAVALGPKVKSKLYFYGGKQEGESMVPDMLRTFQVMSGVSKSKMTTVIRDDGKHNEPTWRKEFPLFYKWMME